MRGIIIILNILPVTVLTNWTLIFFLQHCTQATLMEKVVAFYMREAIRSARTTVYNALKDAGHPKLAELIRRL